MRSIVALLAALALAMVAAPAQRRGLQEVWACPCEHCVDEMGQSVADCQKLGLDCSCLLDCKCQHCVVALGQTLDDCESLGLDCSCYSGPGPAKKGCGGAAATCSDLDARATAVNEECCDEPTEDCSSGRPATCNLGCAHVLLPFFDDCAEALGVANAAQFDAVIELCRAAESATPIDPCAEVDCGAHGSCDGGKCTCRDHYTGTQCQTLADPCEAIDCGAHGSCDGGACTCRDRWHGDRCETRPQTCCSHQDGGYCSCQFYCAGGTDDCCGCDCSC